LAGNDFRGRAGLAHGGATRIESNSNGAATGAGRAEVPATRWGHTMVRLYAHIQSPNVPSPRVRGGPLVPRALAPRHAQVEASRLGSSDGGRATCHEVDARLDARPRGRLSVRFSFVCHACPSGLVCVSRLWCVHLVSCASSSVRTAELRSADARPALRGFFESCVCTCSPHCVVRGRDMCKLRSFYTYSTGLVPLQSRSSL